MSAKPPNRNVEIKARARDWDSQHARAEGMADGAEHLTQVDTFFDCPAGLLKLRDFGDGRGELIHYRRPRETGPKVSAYRIVPVSDPVPTGALLAAAMGVVVTIRKRRVVFHCGQTRVHFDEVEGLGRFIELEVVLLPGQDEDEGRAIADALRQALDIRDADLVAGAYADLLMQQGD